ncbi:nucleotide disphospho-sugar-binding domain-containing protein [Streptomyces sp. HD]|uniref:nucleotide disphospho-sugar-binding domain-containing protein n=1 Tax=Streptomyces sp. HD TaxID=3020892 RepID=UPI0023307477|nr:nucleotide disphospho-sugar-binding domain-containing protein [Streptomyces sp. HD]MDC0772579.1 DUF1205 domain-containing protein [Streptomyces sp. HD]
MRVLLVAQGPSHVPWLIPLSWAARLQGHDVLLATRPPHVGQVTRAGLPVAAVGSEDRIAALQNEVKQSFVAEVRQRMREEGAEDGFAPTEREVLIAGGRKMIAIADGMADETVALVRAWRPDVIVHDTGALVGRVAAAAAGIPAVGHTWGTTMGGFLDVADEGIMPQFAPLFRRFGAEPVTGTAGWIDPSPPSLCTPLPFRRIGLRYTPYSGPGEVPDWLLAPGHRPRVCLTLGVSEAGGGGLHGEEAQRRLLHALTAYGADVVVAVKDARDLPGSAVPSGGRVVESFPLDLLLPTCAAVIHHGGVGTGMTSLALGVPQLVMTGHMVQRHWGQLVRNAGAGLTVEATAGADEVRAAVKRLLTDPALRSGAAGVRAEMAAMPSPSQVVGFLEECAAGAV